MSDKPAKAGRNQAGQFRRGASGNPRGKAPGTRHRTSILLEKMLERDAVAVMETVIAQARAGCTVSQKLVLEPFLPPHRRDRPVSLKLAKIATAADAMRAMSEILQATCDGQVSPSEANGLAGLVDTLVRTIEAVDVEARLCALEMEASRCAP